MQKGFQARLFQFYFHHILPKLGSLLSDKKAYEYLPKSVESFYSPDELKAVITNEGGKILRVKNFLFGACRLFSCEKIR